MDVHGWRCCAAAVEAHANALEADDVDLQSKRDRALLAVHKFMGTADDGRGFNELR